MLNLQTNSGRADISICKGSHGHTLNHKCLFLLVSRIIIASQQICSLDSSLISSWVTPLTDLFGYICVYIYIFFFFFHWSIVEWLGFPAMSLTTFSNVLMKSFAWFWDSFAGFIRQAILIVWKVYSYWSFKIQLKQQLVLDPCTDLSWMSVLSDLVTFQWKAPSPWSITVGFSEPPLCDCELLEGRDVGLFVLIFQRQAQCLEFTRCSRNVWWINEQVPLSQFI